MQKAHNTAGRLTLRFPLKLDFLSTKCYLQVEITMFIHFKYSTDVQITTLRAVQCIRVVQKMSYVNINTHNNFDFFTIPNIV